MPCHVEIMDYKTIRHQFLQKVLISKGSCKKWGLNGHFRDDIDIGLPPDFHKKAGGEPVYLPTHLPTFQPPFEHTHKKRS